MATTAKPTNARKSAATISLYRSLISTMPSVAPRPFAIAVGHKTATSSSPAQRSESDIFIYDFLAMGLSVLDTQNLLCTQILSLTLNWRIRPNSPQGLQKCKKVDYPSDQRNLPVQFFSLHYFPRCKKADYPSDERNLSDQRRGKKGISLGEGIGFAKFLHKKLTGTMPKSYESFVMDCDLYNKEEEPWQIWERFRDKDQEEDLYFFTTLKKKSTKGNDSSIDCTTGSNGNCWHGEDSGSRIDVNAYIKEDYLAIKKRFSYQNRGSQQNGLWIMHEYSLELGQNKSSWVLGWLRKNGDVTANGIVSGKRKRKTFAKKMVTK